MGHVGRIDRAMRGKNDPLRFVIAEHAERQHGVVARWQLLALGVSRYAIDRMIASGYLHPVHRGVHAVGHRKLTARGRTMAAVLACGPMAMASHLTAAWLHGILRDNRSVTDVTVPGRRGGGMHPGVVLHRPRHLHPEDRVIVDGIPCTSLARTLLDVAATRPRLLRRAFEESERRRILDLRAVEATLARHARHPGASALTEIAGQATAPPPRTRSELEEAFLELIRAEGLPEPTMNAMAAGYEVDAVWPEHRLVVEIDHYATHGHRTAFERDRIRDAELQLAGFHPVRVTDTQIEERRATAARLRGLLETYPCSSGAIVSPASFSCSQ